MPKPYGEIDFSNTRIAFSNKSDSELKRSSFLFKIMNKSILMRVLSKLGIIAIRLRLPFVRTIVKQTIFKQFCGGESLLDCQDEIDRLYKYKALTILDYGAESKSSEEDLNMVRDEVINSIEFAASNDSVPVVSTKLTGLVDNDVLIKKQSQEELSSGDQIQFDRLMDRLHMICQRGQELKVGIFIDAEESWMQDAIDDIVEVLTYQYNKDFVVVYNTFQMYRHDRLDYLKQSFENCEKHSCMLGAKIVRGAYMDKERARAHELGIESPIQKTKEDTDKDFDLALEFCAARYKKISSCCASHNLKSSQLFAELIDKYEIPRNHPHVNFSQLLGMSDHITFNLAMAGYNVAKYVPYGPIREVIPYLIRRAKENASVTGEMSRELSLISKEVKRRGI